MATREVWDAKRRLAEAQRCVREQQDHVQQILRVRDEALTKLRVCRNNELRAQSDLDRALAHQTSLRLQLQRVEVTLASAGRQKLISGAKRDVQRERARLRSTLDAAPG